MGVKKQKKSNGNGISNKSLKIKDAVSSLNSEVVKNATDEWSGIEPTNKSMGLVSLTLDKGVKTTIVGTVYGMNFEIEGDGYQVNVFFDYYNKRLKIINYTCTNYVEMLRRLAWLAGANDFDKIFVKAHQSDFQKFLSLGYAMEGVLKYYFDGKDAYVLSRFSSLERAQSNDLLEECTIIEDIMYNSGPNKQRQIPENIKIVYATKEHIPQLVYIYRQLFETYPSPLTNPDYVDSAMTHNVHFMIAFDGLEPVAAASAEINKKHSNAEITDCASIPEMQSKGVMQNIINKLEELMLQEGVTSLYSLARAQSIGMNKSFFRLDYEYSGRLIKNCDIFGKFEDLNIWVKRLKTT